MLSAGCWPFEVQVGVAQCSEEPKHRSRSTARRQCQSIIAESGAAMMKQRSAYPLVAGLRSNVPPSSVDCCRVACVSDPIVLRA